MLVIIASVALVSGFLSVGGYFLLRLYMVRRVQRIDISPFYDPYDMGPAVLGDLRNHQADFGFETGAHGKGWEIQLKCYGRKRAYLLMHLYYILSDSALSRLRQDPFPFVWLHTACMGILCPVAALKILVWPSQKDVLALVGFDSITAEKLAGIKAALRQREDAHID